MWEAVMPVDKERAPVIYEGKLPLVAAVMNAGPGLVGVYGWDERRPDRDEEPEIRIVLSAGSATSLCGSLIRCKLLQGDFAAVGWRIV